MPKVERESFDKLATEKRSEPDAALEQLSSQEILEVLNQEDQQVALRVALVLPVIAEVVDAVFPRMEAGGRLIYIGSGTSGRLGVLDAAECPPTFGVNYETVVGIIAGGDPAIRRAVEHAEDNGHQGQLDLQSIHLNNRDSVVGISASGRTPYVMGALQYARQQGALTIALTNNVDSYLGKECLYAIEVDTGAEILAGSTRLKAGTAQKMVLNMLSTAIMVRMGKTHQNMMVDLRPTNQKLMDRAKRMIRDVCGCSIGEAEALFDASNRNVKVAIVMHQRALNFADAQRLLQASNDDLRIALDKNRGSSDL